MLTETVKKVVLMALFGIPLALAAFPEPFDMHNAIPELVQEMLDKQNKMASQDPLEYSDAMDKHLRDQMSKGSQNETSNDLNRPDSSDCR